MAVSLRHLSPILALLLVGCLPPVSVVPTSTAISEATSPISESTAVPSPTPTDRWIAPAPTKTTGCQEQNGLPDLACTPGATDPRVTQANIGTTICVSGYSSSVRPPSSVTERIKVTEMTAYGFVGLRLADYELDHLVSLELGGSPADVANLWPEPWNDAASVPGAHTKDASENRLHALVCNNTMTLAEAQRRIATDWRTALDTTR